MNSIQSAVIRLLLRKSNIWNRPLNDLRAYMEGIKVRGLPQGITVTMERISGVNCEVFACQEAAQNNALIYFHGGGFCLGIYDSNREFVAKIAAGAKINIYMPDYRLAPENPYPKALEDGVAIYKGLLEKGYEPKNLIVAGDSSGCALAVSALLILKESGVNMPKKLAFITPVFDLAGQGDTFLTKIKKDPFKLKDPLEIAKNYLGSNTLPASEINIDAVSAELGATVALQDIKISVSIAEPSADTVRIVEDTANKNSFQLVVKPVEFEITCTSGDKTVSVSRFNAYVERTIEIPSGIDPSKITTGIVLNADGTFSHVPTSIVVINGKYYAKINSLTNSTYSVIYNPIEFADVANHWAKAAVNDMGSRMIVSGIDSKTYDPDRDITRAQFAAIIIRALGLQAGSGSTDFKDVKTSDWYAGAVKTATEYGIISGYGNGSFGPNDKITREQAMAMIARAMKLTKLDAGLASGEAAKLLAGYTDGEASSAYAKTSIAECLKTGIVSGNGGGILAPKDYITRAEVAVIAQKLLEKSDLI